MSYFKHFPQTTFDGKSIADITRKAQLSKLVSNSVLDYLTYTVAEGERPEDVAYYYYDDASLAWLVLMSNDIIDPYTQWPKSSVDFDKFIISKYAKQSGYTGQQVLDWTKNTNLAQNIIHYQSSLDPELKINRATYINLGASSIIKANKMIAGEEYKVVSFDELLEDGVPSRIISDDDLFSFANTSLSIGSIFTAAVNGDTIVDANTVTVVGSSLKNPAREFYPVRIYDYEFELNESRREIQLINKGYLATVRDQLETILKDA